MLKVKPNQPRTAEPANSTARYADAANVVGRPITLRIDDLPPITVDDAGGRRLLWQLVEHTETLAAVREGMEQVRQGRAMPLDKLDRDLRKKHGLSG